MFKFPQDRDGNPFNVSKQENVGKGKISMQIKFPNPSTIVKWVIFNGLYGKRFSRQFHFNERKKNIWKSDARGGMFMFILALSIWRANEAEQ